MRCILPILILVLTAPPCHAWSACGHHIIALLAYDLLTPTEQQQVLQLLKEHPRFAEDFQIPENVDTPEKRPHWLVGRAGYWPDVARRVPEFNRPTWHYQLGSSLTIGQNVRVPETPGALPPYVTMETRNLHITQAIELCRRVLQDRSQPAPARAVAICWLAHLVADAHQPCHAGSLYAEGTYLIRKVAAGRTARSSPAIVIGCCQSGPVVVARPETADSATAFQQDNPCITSAPSTPLSPHIPCTGSLNPGNSRTEMNS